MDKHIKNKLNELEKTANDFWNITPEVGQFLNILVKLQKPSKILELGTSNGYSTIWLGLAAKQIDAKITTIEYFQERIDLAKNNIAHCDLSNTINIKQGKILEVLDQLDEFFDFVFIDANKPEYLEYIKKLEPKITSKAIIIADNIISHKAKVQNYVDYIFNHPEFDSVLVPIGTGMVLSYRK